MPVRLIPIADIKPASYNPRKDLKPGDAEYEKLKRSIEEFGCVDPLIWNEQTGNLVGGHQRLKILKARGDAEVECSVVDLDPDREKALNIALNKIEGAWDFAGLADLLLDLDAANYDLDLTGYDAGEIKDIMNWTPGGDADPAIGDDDEAERSDGHLLGLIGVAIEPPRHTVISGQCYRLGDSHKLYCGQVTTDWPAWSHYLTAGCVLAVYPGPFVLLSELAAEQSIIMVQPDTYICGHILDRYEDVHGPDSVAIND